MNREAERLRRIRRELDETAENLERLAVDLERPVPNGKLALVGATEIAAMAGTTANIIGTWVSRGQLPPPVAELACGRIWLKSDIQRWLRRR